MFCMSLDDIVLHDYFLLDLFLCNVSRDSLEQADMLLNGSYEKDMEKVFATFRIVRKSMIKRGRITVRTCLVVNCTI